MRVCLVRCPSPFLVDERMLPPLGLMAVGTALKAAGHEVLLYDGFLDGTPVDYDAYGFGPTTPEYPAALAVMHSLRAYNRRAKCVIGGPHATLSPESCVADGWDSVVIGDGEVESVKALANGGGVFVAEERPLDEYPDIDRTLVDLHSYHYTLQDRPATTMMTGQGCPYRCGFCAKNYQTVRYRSVDRVAREIERLRHDFGYTALAFPEDIFILNKERVELICAYLRRAGILWRCLVRGDLVVHYGPEFLERLADSGCVSVSMGIESGSDRILRIIHKGETAATLKQAIRMVKAAGLPVKGFFIVGLPGETPETLAETKAFLDEVQLDEADFKVYQPFPGSPIWNQPGKYDVWWDHRQPLETRFYKGRAGDYRGTLRTSALTTEDIYQAWVAFEQAYKKSA